MEYRIILASGYVHSGDDEREPGEMVERLAEAVAQPETDFGRGGWLAPRGWCWLAGLYVDARAVVAPTQRNPSETSLHLPGLRLACRVP